MTGRDVRQDRRMFFRPIDDLLELTATPVDGVVDVGPVIGGEDGPSFFIGVGAAEAVDVRVHQVAAAPAGLGVRASEVVEFSCVGPGVLWDPHVPHSDELMVVEVPGPHRVRLEVSYGSDEQAMWDLYVWSAEPTEPVVLREPKRAWWVGVLSLPEAADGLAGAARIGLDVDGADGCRKLSGVTGTSVASRVCAGRTSQHRASFFGPHAWTVSATGEAWYLDQNRGVWYPPSADHPDQLAGRTGMLRTHEVTRPEERSGGRVKPARVEVEVTWVVPSAGVERAHLDREGGVPLLPNATLQSTSFRRAGRSGVLATEITVEHSRLPVEWVDDMKAWWKFQLAIQDVRPLR